MKVIVLVGDSASSTWKHLDAPASLQRWISSLQTLQVLSQAKKIRTGGYR